VSGVVLRFVRCTARRVLMVAWARVRVFILSQAPGDLSEVVATESGLHLLLLEKRNERRTVIPYI
jgi:hypothetical protein